MLEVPLSDAERDAVRGAEGSEIADGFDYQVQDEPGPRSLTAQTTATTLGLRPTATIPGS